MEYLSENDDSLQRSLEIADEMGYAPGALSSEILATILQAQIAKDDFYENWDAVEMDIESLADDYMEESQEEEEEQ